MKRKFDNTEERRVQVSKMARLEEIETGRITSGDMVNKYQEASEVENTKEYNNDATNVVFVEYTLNDLSALETKFSMCNVEPIKVSKEAKDGSSIHVDLKTSLFEAMKQNFIPILNTDPDIEKAITSRVTKAKSNSGTANVEYMADIVLIKGSNKHEIILKFFTTKCRIQVQKRGKHVKFPELEDKFVPKFFMDYYIVPLAKKIHTSNPNIDERFVPHLAEEIERLRAINKTTQNINKKGRIPDDAKCINKKCAQKITKNMKVSAQCASCKNFEHFKCAGTSVILKEDIQEDVVKFFCTMCIDENPSLGLEVATNNQRQVTKVQPIVHRPAIELEEIVVVEETECDVSNSGCICDICGNIFQEHKDITQHIERDHRQREITSFKCRKCEEVFISETDLKDHVNSSHTQNNCNKCPFSASSVSELEVHTKANHVIQQDFKCEKCDFETTSELSLEMHLRGHIGDVRSEDLAENLVAENATLKRKYEVILDSYDRLTAMYNTLKEDSKKNVDIYKKELSETQETLRIAVTECEKLKETNDIQNNLWKIWVKQHSKDNTNTRETKNKPVNVEEEILDDNDQDEDPVTVFLRNRRQGYSRVSPAASPEPNVRLNHSKTFKKSERKVSFNTSSNKDEYSKNRYQQRWSESRPQNNKKYCHYWNNAGTCSYRNCRFLHEKSPDCKFDGRCTRNKCMFSHLKQNKGFLAESHRAPSSRTAGYSRPSPPVWATGSAPQYWGPPAPWTQWGNAWGNPGVQQGMANIRRI